MTEMQSVLSIEISKLGAAEFNEKLPEFAHLLDAVVQDGASVGFVLPFTAAQAQTFWSTAVAPSLIEGTTVLFVAKVGEEVAGTVQLVLPSMPNQTHKADVSKMMVHPKFRRRGLARKLMLALLEEAKRRGFHLLTLDTRTNDKAQPLYADLGFEIAGEIPDFAIDPFEPSKLDGTTYMYKRL